MIRMLLNAFALLIVCSLILSLAAARAKSASQKPEKELADLEAHLAKEFNSVRKAAGLKPLAYRKDIRIRKEACSVAEKGADDIVEPPRTGRKYWYVTSDPQTLGRDIKEIAATPTSYGSVGVGVWHAANSQSPTGAYWIVIYPERSAAYEAFWGHFYLTDSFEYITRFDKYWKKRLPQPCRNIQ